MGNRRLLRAEAEGPAERAASDTVLETVSGELGGDFLEGGMTHVPEAVKPRLHIAPRPETAGEKAARVKNGKKLGKPAPAATSEKAKESKILQFPRPATDPKIIEEEARLVEEARRGSTESFSQLVRNYDRKIYRLTLRITGNQEDAADALQEAFMKAYANLKMFHGDSRFYTWLARIAVNEALTKLRKRLSHKQVSLDDDQNTLTYEITDICDNPEQKYAKTELQEILREAIDGLTPALRMVLLLQYLDDCTSEQIAQKLGLSVPAVKSRLMRARVKLRQRLAKQLRPDEAEVEEELSDELAEAA